jgi:phosphopantothenoylcysteine decarboxylase/phosphopantothenate--cysteine ligase
LETQHALENGKSKLERKNLDLIVINTLEDIGAGFGGETNKILLLDKHNKLTQFELKSKQSVAVDILEAIVQFKKDNQQN